jgi:hypothetical protein
MRYPREVASLFESCPLTLSPLFEYCTASRELTLLDQFLLTDFDLNGVNCTTLNGLFPSPPSQVSDYLEVIIQPMDLSTVMTKIDTHKYLTAKNFLVDIDLICSNALEYNPDKEPSGTWRDF